MNPRTPRMFVTIVSLMAALGASALAADNPFLGGWELTIPGGGAGWLGVQEVDGSLRASLLWGGGSVVPLDSAKVEDGKLVVTRKHDFQRRGQDGKSVKGTRPKRSPPPLMGTQLKLTTETPRENGKGEDKAAFTGRREPPMPPAPDLTPGEVRRADPPLQRQGPHRLAPDRPERPQRLEREGRHAGQRGAPGRGQAAQELRQPAHRPRVRGLQPDARNPRGPGGNSGVYLRGIYEVQVVDSYGKPLDPHNMGAIYSRITPTVAAEKPAGEWQTLDITLVDRHVTVILNGKKIIDNQPVLGCTGGALWSDVTRPGPIYLQGDHTGIEYRNIVLRPREE